MARIILGVTLSRTVLGSLNDLALLSRFAIEEQSHIDLTSLAVKIAEPLLPDQMRKPQVTDLGAFA